MTTFASTAGGLRNCNTAALGSFIPMHRKNTGDAGTEPKEAPYAVTVEGKQQL